MTDIAIRVENLSKLYPSGALRAGHIGRAPHSAALRDSLRDALVDVLPRIARKNNSNNSSNSWPKRYNGMYVRLAFAVTVHLGSGLGR
jgi:hypothetical protein